MQNYFKLSTSKFVRLKLSENAKNFFFSFFFHFEIVNSNLSLLLRSLIVFSFSYRFFSNSLNLANDSFSVRTYWSVDIFHTIIFHKIQPNRLWINKGSPTLNNRHNNLRHISWSICRVLGHENIYPPLPIRWNKYSVDQEWD